MIRASVLVVVTAAALLTGCTCPRGADRRFDLQHDSFSFANELHWEYELTDSGEVITHKSDPAPEFSLRCFPMVRVAREFFYHAEFQPDAAKVTEEQYREIVETIMHRNSRCPARPEERIVVPGFHDLRDFSAAHADLLKSECGGAAQSFLQRGNWRMVFPVTKSGQKKCAEQLLAEVSANRYRSSMSTNSQIPA
jgi:hypothetical protein